METSSEDLLFQPISSVDKTVYLYIQLNTVENFPELGGRVFLRLTHPTCRIERHLDNREEVDIDLNRVDEDFSKASFSIRLESDNIDELNNISDNPLSVTLYHTITKHQNSLSSKHSSDSNESLSDLSSEEEELIPVALGYIDLLKFYQRNRAQVNVVTYLYPVGKDFAPAENVICKATWYISTLMPLLQNADISNIAFICLESIYKPPADIMDIYEKLEMALIVTSTKQNETLRKVLCTFRFFKKQIIAQQSEHQQWESMKNPLLNNTESLGTYIGSKISINEIFKNLIWNENNSFNCADINIEEDFALISNSVHRFTLTTEVHKTVESLIGCNEYKLLVELYSNEEPKNIFMQGELNLSILLYPNVNTCRFAVKLKRLQTVRKTSENSSSKILVRKLMPTLNTTTFAVITLSFLTPITELSDEIVNYTESELSKFNLTPSSVIDHNVTPEPTPIKISPNLLYRTLEGFISSFTECIIRQKKPDCDFVVATLNDLITAIVYAHSQNNKPENYIELNELIAVIYNDLELRVSDRIKKLLEKNVTSKHSYKSNETMVLELMNCMKYMYEAGNEEFGNQLFNKLQKEQNENLYFHFYAFLYDVERKKYTEAEIYLSKPQEERLYGTSYFEDIIKIYLNYVNSLENNKSKQPTGELISELRNFANEHCEDITVWILLYCLYHKSYYNPGICYARWKFENLYDTTYTKLPELPVARWQIYNNYEVTFKNKKSQNFYKAMKFLLQIGLYKFGELIYLHLSNQLLPIEDYVMMITFEIFLGKHNNFKLKNFDVYRGNTPRLALILEQLNGCWADYRGDTETAQNYYQLIVRNEKNSLNYEDVQLGLLRYVFAAYAKESFAIVVEALKIIATTNKNILITNMLLGKVFYKIKHFEDALECLKKSAKEGTYIPDIWALLAMVNLQLANNYNALECWKYANIIPNTEFSKEIYKELENIDYSKFSLHVAKLPKLHFPCAN